MKKIILLIMVMGITLGIYICFKDDKTMYLNIGDDIVRQSSYYKDVVKYLKKQKKYEDYIEYSKENYRITDFINDIEDNNIYKDNKTINNLLIKADFISLWIGTNDIAYKIGENDSVILYQYLDDILVDMEKLLQLIRKSSKEKIVLIGMYNMYGDNKEEYINYYNQKLKDLCEKYDIAYIDSNKKTFSKIDNSFISKQIIKIMEK